MTGLHAALAALLAEHSADLPVATDSTTAVFCTSRNPDPPHQRCGQGANRLTLRHYEER
ncbi:hypothetical protein [Pimelobacter simplex]|uniref:hypothetical protein n=1 Tax=Nocardioides simplex TaxID=2045 RepID=UPI001375CCAB|nr:hypothetical protein [Pimelobacter simplex]